MGKVFSSPIARLNSDSHWFTWRHHRDAICDILRSKITVQLKTQGRRVEKKLWALPTVACRSVVFDRVRLVWLRPSLRSQQPTRSKPDNVQKYWTKVVQCLPVTCSVVVHFLQLLGSARTYGVSVRIWRAQTTDVNFCDWNLQPGKLPQNLALQKEMVVRTAAQQ